VLIFVTEESLIDVEVQAFAHLAEPSGPPILPVLRKRSGLHFRSLTGDFTYLGRLNSVGWGEGDSSGEMVFTAIRRHLGLGPFRRDFRLFISYRHSDGSAVAHAINKNRHSNGVCPGSGALEAKIRGRVGVVRAKNRWVGIGKRLSEGP
jgi:hypothetical protein